MTEVKWVPRKELDRVILEILHDEPLISAEELAGAIEWPESTVRDALTRLEARGAVLGVDMGATMRRRRRFFLQLVGLPIRSMQDGPVRSAGPQAALDGLVKQAGRLPMLEAFYHLAPRLCQASFVAPDALGISIHWQNHPHYPIDTKNCGIRGQWTCLPRRLSTTNPLERSWTLWVANTNFRRSKPRGHSNFGIPVSIKPRCLAAFTLGRQYQRQIVVLVGL